MPNESKSAGFETQKAQVRRLSTEFDKIHGSGAAEILINSRRGASGITLKSTISLLKELVAAPHPKASAVIVKPAASIVKPSPAPKASAVPSIMIADWRKLTAYERGKFQATGGKVIAPTMTRAEFKNLSPAAQRDFCFDGGRLIDGMKDTADKTGKGENYAKKNTQGIGANK